MPTTEITFLSSKGDVRNGGHPAWATAGVRLVPNLKLPRRQQKKTKTTSGVGYTHNESMGGTGNEISGTAPLSSAST